MYRLNDKGVLKIKDWLHNYCKYHKQLGRVIAEAESKADVILKRQDFIHIGLAAHETINNSYVALTLNKDYFEVIK